MDFILKKRFQFLVIQGDVLISFNYPDNPYELIIEPNNQITGYPPYCSIDYVYQYILVESYADENCFEDPYSFFLSLISFFLNIVIFLLFISELLLSSFSSVNKFTISFFK